MNDSSIRWLGDVQRLALNPGDTVVLSIDGYIPPEMHERLRETFDRLLPGHTVLVLERGMKLGVLGKET